MRRWQPRTLAGKFLVLQLAVVGLVLSVAAVVSVRQAQTQFRTYAAERILGAAESLASNPLVRERIQAPTAATDLAPVAESVRIQSGSTTVLLVGLDHRIVASSDPTLQATDLALPDDSVWSGRAWGGDTMIGGQALIAASAPVYASARSGPELLGVALVGEAYPSPWSALVTDVPEAALLLGLAALAGVIGSWLLARRIKKQTHGLEPAQIATLSDQREALLYSIHEGVLGVDSDERVTFVNDGARDLLDLPEDCVGRRVEELALTPTVIDVLLGRVTGPDVVVVHRGRALVANRRTARTTGSNGPRSGKPIGTVITLRDRSDLIAVQRQLGATRSATETLRAQTHEFDNQLHIISGLVQLGQYDELRDYVATLTRNRAECDATMTQRVADPSLASLLVAKASLATESSVALALLETSRCPRLNPELSTDVATVAGNLIDNALDAVANADHAVVAVEILADDDEVRVVVADTGPGVPQGAVDHVFARGYSTKSSTVAGGRGIGLSLVRTICERRGGWVTVRSGAPEFDGGEAGAMFTAVLSRRAGGPTSEGDTSSRGDRPRLETA
ncbi:ATP-binding protein [Pseudonocardia sp. H11422]|uniref:sensor histidine kinase n=1 Tax=Pseudonocardia sp. H11422 TaxID=2835866 RepID=UPI001BDBD743|nr:ATP-binding protein [Pseudonocardia sp. H11422]